MHIPFIVYTIQFKLDQSWYKYSFPSAALITIYPRVPPPRDIWPLEREGSNFGGLYIYGKIPQNYLLLSKPFIDLELFIQNPKLATIKEVEISLYQNRILAGLNSRTVVSKYSLSELIDFQNDRLHRTFRVPITSSRPLAVPTSYCPNPEDPDRPWIVEYELEVKFKTGLFSSNIILKFPIFVANIKR